MFTLGPRGEKFADLPKPDLRAAGDGRRYGLEDCRGQRREMLNSALAATRTRNLLIRSYVLACLQVLRQVPKSS